ncbi:MAG: RNA polymerase sigma factor [Bacteroidales bacterium]|nr:RNA polymerase sigma factor [Bacteroidales bacterium]
MSEREYNNCVDELSHRVYGYLYKILKHKETVEDLVQDSFLTLWQQRQNVHIDKAKSFLFVTAHNLMINNIKYSILRSTPTQMEDVYQDNSFENKNLVNYLVEQLNKNMKECLLLRDLEGFSYKEIASIVSLTEENVKVNIFRARVKLKQMLNEIEKQ